MADLVEVLRQRMLADLRERSAGLTLDEMVVEIKRISEAMAAAHAERIAQLEAEAARIGGPGPRPWEPRE